jgi:hypothetical protein
MNEEEFAKRDYLQLTQQLNLTNKNGFFVCIDFIKDEFTYSDYNGEKFSSITAKNMSQLDKVIADKHQNYIETIRALLIQCLNVFYIEEKDIFYSSFTSALLSGGKNYFPIDFFETKPIVSGTQDKIFENMIKQHSSKYNDFEFENSRNDFIKIFKDSYVNSKEIISEMPFSKLSILKKCGNF